MWNEHHLNLLKSIVSGTDAMRRWIRLPKDFQMPYKLNKECFKFKDLLDLKQISAQDPERDLVRIHEACKFLVFEFAKVYSPSQKIFHSSFLDEKMKAYGKITAINTGYEAIASAEYTTRIERRKAISRERLDCLFVTAIPTEFLAIVRRIDYFFRASEPNDTRGFINNPEDIKGDIEPYQGGWVEGSIKRGEKTIAVAVICGEKYGSVAASTAVGEALKRWKNPRHIFIVGIGASLGDESNFTLGDLAYSTGIDDITLGKNTVSSEDPDSLRLESMVEVSNKPDINRLPSKELQRSLKYEDQNLIFEGILRKDEDVYLIKELFDSVEDKNQVDNLAQKSQQLIGVTDLISNLVPRGCPSETIEKADKVAEENRWRNSIHVPCPKPGRSPRVIPTRILSGSRVVKAYGVRNYLIDRFTDNLLLEMEAAGVASACRTIGLKPMVIKAAVDWATPPKADVWHNYSADVAAAFAVELALELS